MGRERSVGSRADLELAGREVAGPGVQVRGGVAFAVPLLAVALRAVLEVELLARLPLRLGPDVGSLRAHQRHRRGTRQRDQDRDEPARLSGERSFVLDLLLGARLLSGEIVEEEDRLPHLVFLQELLPRRHGRVPGTAFLGQSRDLPWKSARAETCREDRRSSPCRRSWSGSGPARARTCRCRTGRRRGRRRSSDSRPCARSRRACGTLPDSTSREAGRGSLRRRDRSSCREP